ncbi:hypothetical protein J6590_015909 [Homalodisca vitripennis]|nr:hypothetical protein J6590_015909 [Homalodisca vitripennis]
MRGVKVTIYQHEGEWSLVNDSRAVPTAPTEITDLWTEQSESGASSANHSLRVALECVDWRRSFWFLLTAQTAHVSSQQALVTVESQTVNSTSRLFHESRRLCVWESRVYNYSKQWANRTSTAHVSSQQALVTVESQTVNSTSRLFHESRRLCVWESRVYNCSKQWANRTSTAHVSSQQALVTVESQTVNSTSRLFHESRRLCVWESRVYHCSKQWANRTSTAQHHSVINAAISQVDYSAAPYTATDQI